MNKKIIIQKIKILIIRNFAPPEEAFEYYDNNNDYSLSVKEMIQLLKDADVRRILRKTVVNKLIEGLDENANEKIEWHELEKLVQYLDID